MQNIQILKYMYILFKDAAMVHVTCVMCYTGIDFHCAQGVLGTSWPEYLVHMGLKV